MPIVHRICGTWKQGVQQSKQKSGQGSRQEVGQIRIEVK